MYGMILLVMVILLGCCLQAEDLDGHKHFSESLFENTFAIQADSCCLGTGFFIGCESTGKVLFVTARHVLDSMPGDTATIILRQKSADGSWKLIPLRHSIRSNGVAEYAVHTSPEVDVAAFYLKGNLDSTFIDQFLPFSANLLARDADIRKYWIHPGDELFYLGFPAAQSSPKGAFPILRSGFVSSYPILPLKDHPFIYLDGSVFDGNSGGPVYFERDASSWNGRAINQQGLIVGLISFSLTPEVLLKIDQTKKKRDLRIGGFVNSELIWELLESMGCE